MLAFYEVSMEEYAIPFFRRTAVEMCVDNKPLWVLDLVGA